MKNFAKILLIILTVVVVTFGIRYIFGGSEDGWLCVNGEWINYGQSSEPKPASGCGHKISNFDECAAAGNAIMESYPAQCRDSEGNLFAEIIGNEQEKINIKVFFNNSKMDPEFTCVKVFSVMRQVDKTEAVARAALEELLKGPSDNEKVQGFLTTINEGVEIQKLIIEKGVAKVDFNNRLEEQVGGACRVGAIAAEITETLRQFPVIKKVIISIDGRIEDILQP
jgi:spore germination protein GerM